MTVERVISLDPSSTIIGWATFWDEVPKDASRIKRKSGVHAEDGIELMTDKLWAILREKNPSIILVEYPIGRQHSSKEGGRATALAIWAAAAGEVRATCRAYAKQIFYEKDENVRVVVIGNAWHKGKSKVRVQTEVMALYPRMRYDHAKDKGADVADAILMANYWFHARKTGVAMKGQR